MKKLSCTLLALVLTFSMLFSCVVSAADFSTESWGNGYFNISMEMNVPGAVVSVKGVINNEDDFDKLYADLDVSAKVEETTEEINILVNDGKICLKKGDLYKLFATGDESFNDVFSDYKDSADYVTLLDKQTLQSYLGVDIDSLTQTSDDDITAQLETAIESSRASLEQLGITVSDEQVDKIIETAENIITDFGKYVEESKCLEGIFTSDEDKITVKFDEKSLIHAVCVFMDYAVTNREEITGKIKGYCENLTGISAELDEVLTQLPDRFSKTMIEFAASKVVNLDMENQLLAALQGVTFSFDFELDNASKTFKLDLNAKADEENSVNIKYDIYPAGEVTEKEIGEAPSLFEELDEKYKSGKLGVVSTMITWGSYDDSKENNVNVSYYTSEGSQLPIMYSFYNIDGSIYLPLRSICETNGETVTWDSDAKQAYVNEVPMAGIIRNDKTYVKVRDFEKLGYTVDYQEVNGMHMASISKTASDDAE